MADPIKATPDSLLDEPKNTLPGTETKAAPKFDVNQFLRDTKVKFDKLIVLVPCLVGGNEEEGRIGKPRISHHVHTFIDEQTGAELHVAYEFPFIINDDTTYAAAMRLLRATPQLLSDGYIEKLEGPEAEVWMKKNARKVSLKDGIIGAHSFQKRQAV